MCSSDLERCLRTPPRSSPERGAGSAWRSPGGQCFDNAAAEAFFSSLEWEVLSRNSFSDTIQARAAVIDWCYTFYKHQRRHSAADGLSPSTTRSGKPNRSRRRLKKPSTISGEPQVPEHLHEGSHVPRSPRHSRPLPGPPGGAPERSEPEQHLNPRRTRPRGGELRDGRWGIT